MDGTGTLPPGFPGDWLERGRDQPATDLDLAVLLVNSHDLLADPADRLTDLSWFSNVLHAVGHAPLADELTPADLPRLRELRSALRRAFEAATAAEAAAALNPLLEQAPAVFVLVVGDDAASTPQSRPVVRFEVAPHRSGIDALEARLPAALAGHIAERGIHRLGVCTSDPCRCAFVDRTRAATRRYCCSYCNDRAAARAYRRRRAGDGGNT
jgi:predicted RNA-binding Zn ribbon-like protein